MTSTWATIAIMGILAVAQILWSPAVPSRLNFNREANGSRSFRLPPRPPALVPTHLLGWQLVLVFTLFFTHSEGGWSLTAVGVTHALSPGITFALGFLCYYLFASICHIASRLRASLTFDEISFLAIRATWPRHPAAKIIDLLASCVLNPATEELMYRGILIFLFGSLIGSYVVSVSIGLFLCLGAHLYQGVRALPYHALFFAFTVGLLFSPLGLIGSVGLHFAGDLLPFLQSRATVQKWRAHLRRRRMAAIPCRSNGAFS